MIVLNPTNSNRNLYMGKICKYYIKTSINTKSNNKHTNEVKRRETFTSTTFRGDLLGHPNSRPTTLRTWPTLERVEEVGNGWRMSGEAKHQGKGRGKGKEMVENEGEGAFL